MLVRQVFHMGARKTTQALAKHAPEQVASIVDLQYREHDGDAFLDVHFPAKVVGTDEVLPTVIWTHGGAWISGTRANYRSYYQLIADAGFTMVSLDYTLGPEGTYPLRCTNCAMPTPICWRTPNGCTSTRSGSSW